MRFPIMITVDNSYLLAVADTEFSKYLLVSDAIKYEPIYDMLTKEGHSIRKIKVFKDSEFRILFTASMLDSNQNILPFYASDEIMIFNISSSDLNMADRDFVYNGVKNTIPQIDEFGEFKDILKGIGSEISEESVYIQENGRARRGFVQLCTRGNIVISFPKDIDEKIKDAIIKNYSEAYTDLPDSRVFMPVPTVKNLIAACKGVFNDNDYIFDIAETREFMTDSQVDNYIDNSVRKDLSDLVTQKISSYINLTYDIDRLMYGLQNVTDDAKATLKQIAIETIHSIYRKDNLESMGFNMNSTGLAYRLVFGGPDTETNYYPNEMDFVEALENLYMGTLLYENEVFSEAQLIAKCGRIPKSEWFERWIINQIEYILRARYSYTGKVTPSFYESYSSVDDDDDDDDSKETEIVADMSPMLYRVIKDGADIQVIPPDSVELMNSVEKGTISNTDGVSALKGYLHGMDSWKSSISTMIQLLRLGERKSQYVEAYYDKEVPNYPYFDTMTLSPSRIIEIERPYTNIKTEAGNDFSIGGVVTLTRMLDGINIQLPIAVILNKLQSNGRVTRKCTHILDTSLFVTAMTRLNKEGQPYYKVDGFKFNKGIAEYDRDLISQQCSVKESAVTLEQMRVMSSEDLIVECRTSIASSKRINIACAEAGIESKVGDMEYTLLTAVSKFELGEVQYSTNSTIDFDKNNPKDYVYKTILKMYLDNILLSQKHLVSSGSEVSICTLLDVAIQRTKDKQMQSETATQGVSLFDQILDIRNGYHLDTYLKLISDDKAHVGYGFTYSKNGARYILIGETKEIGNRLPVLKGNQKLFPVSKLLGYSHVARFYSEEEDLNKQLQKVANEHKIVLASTDTLRLLLGDRVR